MNFSSPKNANIFKDKLNFLSPKITNNNNHLE
jgi:hypothetical protein